MRIGIYHGYELTGSGSNEYTRYLTKTLNNLGHEVHVICRETSPEKLSFLSKAYIWDKNGNNKNLFSRNTEKSECILHQLPEASVRPVYVTDKQREGNVKPFVSLSGDELDEYHTLNENLILKILQENHCDILHANHLIYQPIAALQACKTTAVPLAIFPHGSSIEYVIRCDDRYKKLALQTILECAGLIIGNNEVRDRIVGIYPEYKKTILDKTQIVGVGVDTALFQPVNRSGRKINIEALKETNGNGGKNPEKTKELFTRLENMDIDATKDYWDTYNHSLPDDDLNVHINRIPIDNNILLFVGALTSGKGLQSLITAFPFILSRHPDTHLIIVGAGAYREVLEGLTYAIATSNESLFLQLCSQGMDLDRNELTGPWEDVKVFIEKPEKLSHIMKYGKNIVEQVHFLGRLEHERLQFLFPCADLAVFPSIVPEAYPLVLMESLSNGVLPVVSYFSGFKDGLDELRPHLGDSLVNSLTISVDPSDRIESIIQHITNLLSRSDLDNDKQKLRQIAVDNYDWKIQAAKLVEAYSKIIKNF